LTSLPSIVTNTQYYTITRMCLFNVQIQLYTLQNQYANVHSNQFNIY